PGPGDRVEHLDILRTRRTAVVAAGDEDSSVCQLHLASAEDSAITRVLRDTGKRVGYWIPKLRGGETIEVPRIPQQDLTRVEEGGGEVDDGPSPRGAPRA